VILRAVTAVYAAVFLAAAAFNFGVAVTIGPVELGFSVPIWQAGLGELVIGVVLGAAALTERARLYWIAYVLSAFGIAFGLLSVRVVGAARDIHIVLVPLAILGFALLIARRRSPRAASG